MPDGLILPPASLRFMGESDSSFLEIGSGCLNLLRNAGFCEDSSILDIGSGYGRLATAITRGLDYRGVYEGFDILSEHIRWCRENISVKWPHFHFTHIDIQNGRYNPEGTLGAEDFRFPYPTAHFDFASAFSVFTHLHEGDIRRYLSEIARVLVPDGVAIATFFLYDAARLERIRTGNCPLSMDYRLNDHTIYHNASDILHAIAYDHDSITGTIAECGLDVQKVNHGNWAGDTSDEYQDVIVFKKRGPTR
jgi:SAM-dependent methyltransferase